MDTKCDVIRDLMPLYVDQVLSDASKELVEAHTGQCGQCGEELAALSVAVPAELTEGADITEKQAMQVLGKSIRRRIKWRVLLAVALTALLALGAYWGHFYLFVLTNTPVAVANLEYKLAETSDGQLVFEHRVISGPDGGSMTWGSEEIDGERVLLIEPTRPMFGQPAGAPVGRFNRNLLGYQMVDGEVLDARFGLWEENGAYVGDDRRSVGHYTKIMLGGKKDRVLLWQKGDTLPRTDPAIERELAPWDDEDEEDEENGMF